MKKVFLGLAIAFLGFILLILLQQVDPKQYDPFAQSFSFAQKLNPEQLSQDSLWDVVGDNKTVPPGFEKAALVAYSAYPQLKEVQIEMILTESGAPMESNFDIKTLFGTRKNRVYQILLNNAGNTGFDPILLRSLPFDSQVGILAHELGHVAYYHQLSTIQLAKWGLMYLVDSDFRATHERSTDLMPIYHGLGYQIHDYAWYLRNDPTCKPLYEAFGKELIDKYYMTDQEIYKALISHPLYK